MDSIKLGKVQDWRHYREDQVEVRPSDFGTAPSGTQIAQPRLSFARPALARGDSKPAIGKEEVASIVEDAEEYTANPDRELQEKQAEEHAYGDQQFYEKTGFNE